MKEIVIQLLEKYIEFYSRMADLNWVDYREEEKYKLLANNLKLIIDDIRKLRD